MTSAHSRTTTLASGWRLYRTAPGDAAEPRDLDRRTRWYDAVVPGTVASSLFGDDADLFHPGLDLDAFDWWYETEFEGDPTAVNTLVFDGLATIAEVWLNGRPIHASRNMFRRYRADVSRSIASTNHLAIVFRSVSHDLKTRRPRPRWKTNLVNHQQLRWLRTSLLGRIPGWTPPVPPIGPWRDVILDVAARYCVDAARVVPSCTDAGNSIAVDIALRCIGGESPPLSATLAVGDERYALDQDSDGERCRISGTIAVGELATWWPHTHGEPALHRCSVVVDGAEGEQEIWSGSLGFRKVAIDRDQGRVSLRLNDTQVFARGGCWTTNDVVSLTGNETALRRKLERMRDAGVNMIRIGGTMVYESRAFHETCDELGIMVWQDFMFANMDYPTDDPDFLEEASAEVREHAARLATHASTAVLCGGSETEQQPAMFGMTEETWVNPFYYETVPAIIEASGCDVPYFPSSPCEGALPFHNATGIAHYFGVGAYQQPFSDLDRSRVRFATECLAFSNIPDDAALRKHFGGLSPATHGPAWKTGIPRDASAGWDFEDIRDHYIRQLYGIDPVQLRYADNGRYIAISQVVTGEIMEHVFNHWRSFDDDCGGGLTWWLNDLVPGAGWGMLDSDGNPKPLYYFLRRCWSGTTVSIDDRGLDGLFARITNESSDTATGQLHVRVLQHASQAIAEETVSVSVPPATTEHISIDKLLGRFFDTTYTYRFGPPKHDVVVVTLEDGSQRNPLVATHYPGDRNLHFAAAPDLTVRTETDGDTVVVRLRASCFLKAVKLQSTFYEFDDNYFDLPPDTDWTVTARALTTPARPFRATVSALNLEHPVPVS